MKQPGRQMPNGANVFHGSWHTAGRMTHPHETIRAIEGLGERGSLDYYMPFGM